jgi:hypothetical protein
MQLKEGEDSFLEGRCWPSVAACPSKGQVGTGPWGQRNVTVGPVWDATFWCRYVWRELLRTQRTGLAGWLAGG